MKQNGMIIARGLPSLMQRSGDDQRPKIVVACSEDGGDLYAGRRQGVGSGDGLRTGCSQPSTRRQATQPALPVLYPHSS